MPNYKFGTPENYKLTNEGCPLFLIKRFAKTGDSIDLLMLLVYIKF